MLLKKYEERAVEDNKTIFVCFGLSTWQTFVTQWLVGYNTILEIQDMIHLAGEGLKILFGRDVPLWKWKLTHTFTKFWPNIWPIY